MMSDNALSIKTSQLVSSTLHHVEAELPASTGQKRMWYITQTANPSYAYNDQMEVRVEGFLDISFLEDNLTKVVERHQALRTVFREADNADLVQVVLTPFAVKIPLIAVGKEGMSAYQLEKDISRLSLELGQAEYDLTQGPLFRVHVLQLPNSKQVFLFSFHHSIMDGRSLVLLLEEINALYSTKSQNGESTLGENPILDSEYAVQEKQWMQTEDFQQRLSYWKEHLKGAPTSLNFPFDYPRPTHETFHGASRDFKLPKQLTTKLSALARRENVSLYTVLLAAYKTLLMRYSGQKDVSVATVISNRQRPELKKLMGFLAETVILRSDLSAKKTFKQLLRELRELTNEAFYDQVVPFNKVAEILHQDRSFTDAPLCQAALLYKSIPFKESRFSGLRAKHPTLKSMEIAKFDITLSMELINHRLSGNIEYNTGLIGAKTAKRFLTHYRVLLESIAKNAGLDITKIPLLNNKEQYQVVDFWNQTKDRYPLVDSIQNLFEEQAAKTPYAIALTFEHQKLNYDELNKRSNQLAHHLIERGVKPNTRVGLFVERSPELAIGILAILKAGGAYVPLDPSYPAERLAYMLKNAGAHLLLTQKKLIGQLTYAENKTVFLDDDSNWKLARDADKNPRLNGSIYNLAYVIYTSGSTGHPKGVAMPHLALANLIQWQITSSGCSVGSKTLQFSSFCFDVSFQEMFSTWGSGGNLIMTSDELRRDSFSLWNFISDVGINRLFMPFIALQQLAEAYEASIKSTPGAALKPKALQEVITAGEQLQITPPIRAFFQALKPCKLFNHYGPSETHVATSLELSGKPESWDSLPSVGKPIANDTIYILDNSLQPVPIGVYGEIYIGGAGLAQGYLGRDDLTKEKFIPNPFSKRRRSRLYKTGDLARYRSDGNIEYKGRADNQVKVQGFRIEPGEIENFLVEQPEIKEAVILACSHNQGAQDKYLAAYVVPELGIKKDEKLIRQRMQASLPHYMVPSVFIFLEELPLTPSGKIDRRALPIPEITTLQAEEYVAPRTETQVHLTEIWAEVLSLPVNEIGINANFSELGGHSLLATRLISRINRDLNVELKMRDLPRAITIHALATIISEKINQKALAKSLLRRKPTTANSNREEIVI